MASVQAPPAVQHPGPQGMPQQMNGAQIKEMFMVSIPQPLIPQSGVRSIRSAHAWLIINRVC